MEHERDDCTNCDWCFWHSDREIWKLAAEWRPSKRQHYWRWPEYWEESGRLEETCCHTNSSEKPSANVDEKNSQRVYDNNEIQTDNLIPVRWADHVIVTTHGRPKNYMSKGRFRVRQNEAERQRSFTEKPRRRLCVRTFQPYSNHTYSTHTYISGNKKEKKRSRLYSYTSALLFFFAVYKRSTRLRLEIIVPKLCGNLKNNQKHLTRPFMYNKLESRKHIGINSVCYSFRLLPAFSHYP